MKTKILFCVIACLMLLGACYEDKGHYDYDTPNGIQPKQNCAWHLMNFTFWVIGKNLLAHPNNGRTTQPIVRRTVTREVVEPCLMEP